MSALSPLYPLATEIGNRLLASDPTTLGRLASLDGKVIALEFEGTDLCLYMLPNAGGIRLREDWDGEVDVHMIGRPAELLKMGLAARSPVTPGRIKLRIDGDLHVGQEFKRILDDLDIDWDGLLARVIGDTAAYHTGRLVREMARQLREGARNLGREGSEYLLNEAELLAPRRRVREHLDAVDRLRQDVDRLAARVQRLARTR